MRKWIQDKTGDEHTYTHLWARSVSHGLFVGLFACTILVYPPSSLLLDILYLRLGFWFGSRCNDILSSLLTRGLMYLHCGFVSAHLFVVLFLGCCCCSRALGVGFLSCLPWVESLGLFFRSHLSFTCMVFSAISAASSQSSPSFSSSPPSTTLLNFRFLLLKISRLSVKLFLGSTLRLLRLSSHLVHTPPSLTRRRFIRFGHLVGSKLCITA